MSLFCNTFKIQRVILCTCIWRSYCEWSQSKSTKTFWRRKSRVVRLLCGLACVAGYWLERRPNQHKMGHFGDVLQANLLAWYGKQNLTQQKHTFINQKKCTTTQNRHKKTKCRFSRLLRHPVWKRSGSVLVSALHKFVTYLHT